jgi:mono/diheme cytochrome c family protein
MARRARGTRATIGAVLLAAGLGAAAASAGGAPLLAQAAGAAAPGKAPAAAPARPPTPPGGGAGQLARGRYLAGIMDCAGCHTPGALTGKPDGSRNLAGSEIGFQVPGVGVVFPKNLTPDPETGLGGWTADDIIRAVRQGKGKDGRTLIPVMPWPSYAALTDADARALAAYLRSLKPIRNPVPRDTKEGEKPSGAYLTVVAPN